MAMHLINDNKPHEFTAEEHRMGGVASGKARRRKRSLKQIGDMIGQLPIKNPGNLQMLKDAGIESEDAIYDVGMIFNLSLRAQKGDPRAVELLSKLRGQLTEHIETIDLTPPVPLSPRKRRKK